MSCYILNWPLFWVLFGWSQSEDHCSQIKVHAHICCISVSKTCQESSGWVRWAVQEMCVSRPRWCEAIFRENPKTRKRENGQENAKTARTAKTRKPENAKTDRKTRKPRKRHLYTMIYSEGCGRWRVKSATWRLKRNLLEGSLPYNIAKSLQVGRICMRPSWIAPWEFCFCLFRKFQHANRRHRWQPLLLHGYIHTL